MEWASERQVDMIGPDGDAALAYASAMHDLGLWEDGTAIRYRLRTGDAAWLNRTKGNKLMVIAVSPWYYWITTYSVIIATLFDP